MDRDSAEMMTFSHNARDQCNSMLTTGPDVIYGDLQPQGVQRRLNTSHCYSRNPRRAEKNSLTASKTQIRYSDFNNIQRQIQEYQNKLKGMQNS